MEVEPSKRLFELFGEIAKVYRSQGDDPAFDPVRVSDDFKVCRALTFEQVCELTGHGVGRWDLLCIADLNDPQRISKVVRLVSEGVGVEAAIQAASRGPATELLA